MTYKIVQMALRGLTLGMMILGLFLNSELENLDSTEHFVASGVYGGYAVVTMGLLLEAGLRMDSDKFVEASYLILAMILNFICTVLSIIEFSSPSTYKNQCINKGAVSVLSILVYLVDLILLYV